MDHPGVVGEEAISESDNQQAIDIDQPIGSQQSGTVIDVLQCASTSVKEQLSSNVSEKTPEKPLMVRTDE